MRRLLLLALFITSPARRKKRLAELEPRLRRSSDPQDLQAISRQQRDAFYQCD